jgi:hypothetical protein
VKLSPDVFPDLVKSPGTLFGSDLFSLDKWAVVAQAVTTGVSPQSTAAKSRRFRAGVQ